MVSSFIYRFSQHKNTSKILALLGSWDSIKRILSKLCFKPGTTHNWVRSKFPNFQTTISFFALLTCVACGGVTFVNKSDISEQGWVTFMNESYIYEWGGVTSVNGVAWNSRTRVTLERWPLWIQQLVDCAEVAKEHRESGVYYIRPLYSACPIPVWCDMETYPGGWLVFQRREKPGKVNFNRDWAQYRQGFGEFHRVDSDWLIKLVRSRTISVHKYLFTLFKKWTWDL